jgi:hypothetical protein
VTLTKVDELALSTFERKVLRKIYGPVYGRGEWRIRYNHELCQLYNTPNITRFIKIARLRWAGHLHRMSDNEMPRRSMECKQEGRRSVGRPRLRWKDGVEDDLRKLNVKNWWTVAKDRESWKKIIRKLRLTKGCRADADNGCVV